MAEDGIIESDESNRKRAQRYILIEHVLGLQIMHVIYCTTCSEAWDVEITASS